MTANVGKKIFEALGVGDHMTYESTSGSHCAWRSGYEESLQAMVDRFLFDDASAKTGNVHSEDSNPPDPEDHYEWDASELAGEL